jgi:hypothetical protein
VYTAAAVVQQAAAAGNAGFEHQCSNKRHDNSILMQKCGNIHEPPPWTIANSNVVMHE